MTPADIDSRMAGGNQRARDPQLLLVAEKMLGVIGAKCEAKQSSHRPKRDVTLFPAYFQAERLLALVFTHTNDPCVGNRGCIGPRVRIGQRKAGNVDPLRQPREVMVLLLVGAIVQQQFARTERVGDHYRHGNGPGMRRELGDHLRMRIRGKSEPTVSLGNDHPEKTLVLDVLPCVCGKIPVHLGRLPVADHRTELLALAIEKPLLLRGELRAGHGKQLAPIRPSGEKLAVPPHRTRLDGVALGLRHGRKHFAKHRKNAVADELATQDRHIQGDGKQYRCHRQDQHRQQRDRMHRPRRCKRSADRDGPCPPRGVDVGQRKKPDDDCEQPEDGQHRELLSDPGLRNVFAVELDEIGKRRLEARHKKWRKPAQQCLVVVRVSRIELGDQLQRVGPGERV